MNLHYYCLRMIGMTRLVLDGMSAYSEKSGEEFRFFVFLQMLESTETTKDVKVRR